MDRRLRRRAGRPCGASGCAAGVARMAVCRRRRACALAMRTSPMRANGSRRLPSPSRTSSGKPSTRPHRLPFGQTRRCRRARRTAAPTAPDRGARASTAMAPSDDGIGRNDTDGDAEKHRHRQRHRHAHAGDRAAHHDAFAMQFDQPHALVRPRVARPEADGQRKRIEPQRAARSGRGGPAGTHLTPRICPCRPGSLALGCRRETVADELSESA